MSGSLAGGVLLNMAVAAHDLKRHEKVVALLHMGLLLLDEVSTWRGHGGVSDALWYGFQTCAYF